MSERLRGSPAIAVAGVEIAGSASAFPAEIEAGRELTNEEAYRELLGETWRAELERRGFTSEHPETAWGVRRRQWLGTPGRPETAQADAADLALHATRKALADARLDPGAVELLVVATSTPPRISSTLAGRVGRELGIEAPCLDLRAGGAGGLCAWITALAYLNAGCANAVVVAAEALSPVLDPGDLATALLFGDGAAALVLSRCDDERRGLVWARSGNADVPGRAFTVPGPLPPTRDLGFGGYVFQAPDASYSSGLTKLRASIAAELARAAAERGLALDVAVPYAATEPQARAQAEALGVPFERVASTLAEHGCLGAAAPLAAIDELRRASRAPAGTIVAATAAGGGVAWGSLLWRT